MKRCPQCNRVFEDEMTYCKEDGNLLVSEKMPLPSDFTPEDHDDGEQETVLRYKPDYHISQPIIPDPPQTKIPQQPPVNPYAPNHANLPPQTQSKTNRGCLKYAMILIVGLIIGGGAVLAIMGIGFFYMNNSSNENRNSNIEETKKDTPKTNSNKDSSESSSKDHSEKNSNLSDIKLNGRIIRNRASLRSSPTNGSKRIDSLPKDDRIEIIRRKSSTSSWYEIQCEHGSKGWISGYAIEFTE